MFSNRLLRALSLVCLVFNGSFFELNARTGTAVAPSFSTNSDENNFNVAACLIKVIDGFYLRKRMNDRRLIINGVGRFASIEKGDKDCLEDLIKKLKKKYSSLSGTKARALMALKEGRLRIVRSYKSDKFDIYHVVFDPKKLKRNADRVKILPVKISFCVSEEVCCKYPKDQISCLQQITRVLDAKIRILQTRLMTEVRPQTDMCLAALPAPSNTGVFPLTAENKKCLNDALATLSQFRMDINELRDSTQKTLRNKGNDFLGICCDLSNERSGMVSNLDGTNFTYSRKSKIRDAKASVFMTLFQNIVEEEGCKGRIVLNGNNFFVMIDDSKVSSGLTQKDALKRIAKELRKKFKGDSLKRSVEKAIKSGDLLFSVMRKSGMDHYTLRLKKDSLKKHHIFFLVGVSPQGPMSVDNTMLCECLSTALIDKGFPNLDAFFMGTESVFNVFKGLGVQLNAGEPITVADLTTVGMQRAMLLNLFTNVLMHLETLAIDLRQCAMMPVSGNT